MNIELAIIMIGVLLLMAWSWRYRDDENRALRDKVDDWRQRCADLSAQVAVEKLKRELLETELGASADAVEQDVEKW